MKKIGDIIGKSLTATQIADLEERLKKELNLNSIKIERKYPDHPGDDTYSYFTDDDCVIDIILSRYNNDLTIGKIDRLNDEGQIDPHGATRVHSNIFVIKSK
jgi:hypothetical protein